MAFQVSPGVNVSEIDLTTVVPAVATSTGALAGVFRWGPVNEPILVNSENSLVARFGEPYANTTWSNAETFFTAANFLSYSNSLYVIRTNNAATRATLSGVAFEAKYPGALGNSLEVLVTTGATADVESVTYANEYNVVGEIPGFSIDVSEDRFKASFSTLVDGVDSGYKYTWPAINDNGDQLIIGDIIQLNDGTRLEVEDITSADIVFASKYTGLESITTGEQDHYTIQKIWRGATTIGAAPTSANNIHVVVTDKGGEFTGVPGTVLEAFDNLSLTVGARRFDGSSNYYADFIEENSNYIVANTSNTPVRAYIDFSVDSAGDDGTTETGAINSGLATSYDLLKNADDIDVSLIMTGRSNATVASYIIDNIVEYRKDAIAFISAGINDISESEIVTFRNTLPSSSYAVCDTGYKYQYDKYNDTYRWVPMNGDIAGLCARTDDLRDPWFSPAGYNRGNIKNVIKLRFNPNKAQRDVIYGAGVNPVVTQPGQGTVLFGDKTLLSTPSAFDRINVRRLFIVLEKAVSRASKSTLFEFNDEFTRAQFRNLVEPFLRDVQGRRGIYDFKVVCDETNNTPEVIDGNRFVGDIYIKPARSINFIQLNFIAVRTGVEFEEIVGQF